MSIIGITHNENGQPKVRRTITTKLAIGLPPDETSNYPKKLDHIVFLKKIYQGKEMKWVIDEELTAHYGEKCAELYVVLFDDDMEAVLPTMRRAYSARGCFCRGDGVTAERRPGYAGKPDDPWNPFQIYKGPCANAGCPIDEAGKCKPTGTMYFMLKDFPSLGSLCKLSTTSEQSIGQLYSALQDLRNVTGGRLMGIHAKLFIHPDKSMYANNNGKTVSGIKFCWGLSLGAKDFNDMSNKMLEGARAFKEIRGELAGRVIEVEEDETEVAAEMTGEFFPDARQDDPPIDPEIALAAGIDALLEAAGGTNKAQRTVAIGQHKGKLAEYLVELKAKAKAKPANGNGHAAAPPPAARQIIAEEDLSGWGF